MRLFVLAVLVVLVAADVSELAGNGYNYPNPSGYDMVMESHHGGHDGAYAGHGGDGGFHGGHGADGGYHGGHGTDGGYHGGHGGDGGFHGGNGGFVGGHDGGLGGDGFGSGAPLGGSGGELDFDMRPAGGMPEDHEISVSKRYFTVTAKDDGDDDDHDESTSTSTGGGHKTYDVVFANNPATGSLKSALRAVSKFAGDHQTNVYVLSQQLGAKQLGEAIRSSGIKPSKPQVHFLKYKTPEEAALAQQQLRAQYDRLGGSSEDGGHETSPVHSTGYRRRGSTYGSRGGNYGGSSSGLGAFEGHRNSYGAAPSGLGGYRDYASYNQGPSGLSNQYLPPRHGSHSSRLPSRGLSNQYLPPRY